MVEKRKAYTHSTIILLGEDSVLNKWFFCVHNTHAHFHRYTGTYYFYAIVYFPLRSLLGATMRIHSNNNSSQRRGSSRKKKISLKYKSNNQKYRNKK